MTYDDAVKKLDDDPLEHISNLLDYKNSYREDEAIQYIMEKTGCDDIIAKAIYFDTTSGLGRGSKYAVTEEEKQRLRNSILPQSSTYDYDTAVKEEQQKLLNPNIPKCPTCQSMDIRPHSRSMYYRTSFKCNNCGYIW